MRHQQIGSEVEIAISQRVHKEARHVEIVCHLWRTRCHLTSQDAHGDRRKSSRRPSQCDRHRWGRRTLEVLPSSQHRQTSFRIVWVERSRHLRWITSTFTGPRQTSLFPKAARPVAPCATYCYHAVVRHLLTCLLYTSDAADE